MEMVAEEKEVVESANVEECIRKKLETFDEVITNSHCLHIDGCDTLENLTDGKNVNYISPDNCFIKVINHKTEVCWAVSIDAIVKQKVETIVRALETGEMIRLQGITRIVGYYSRVHNWNKSKIAELADRGKGNYKLKDCKGLVDNEKSMAVV